MIGRGTKGSVGSVRLTISVPAEMAAEMFSEADRQERPVSWLLREAWKVARNRIKAFSGGDGQVPPGSERLVGARDIS
jgi:uncharacterized small protein (TIGR04563 family)